MKNSNKIPQDAQDIYNEIVNKCWENNQFKKELISKPKEVLESVGFQTELPSGFNIQVTDQADPNTIYINIPPNPESLELTDDMLDNVSGGIHSGWYYLIKYFSPSEVGKRHALADNETYGC